MHSSHKGQKIHNLAIVGQDGVGKTTIVDKLLRIKRKQPGSEIIIAPEEKERGYTIYNRFYHLDIGDTTLNILDTPGNTNFISSVKSAVHPATTSIFVVSSIVGSEESLRIWEAVHERKSPRVIFVNLLDQPQAKFEETLQGLETNFSIKPAVLFIPWFEDDNLVGVIDIMAKKLLRGSTGNVKTEDLPADAVDAVELHRSVTYERLAELNDELMEYYIEEKDAPDELLIKVMSEAVKTSELTPALAGSAELDIGLESLFDFITTNLPTSSDQAPAIGRASKEEDSEDVERSPDPEAPFSGFVFRTTYDRYIGKLSFMQVLSGTFNKNLKLINSSEGRKLQVGKFYILNGDKSDEIEEAVPGDIVVLEKIEELDTNQTLCDADKTVCYQPIEFWEPRYTNRLELTNSSKDSRIMDSLNKLIAEDPSLKMEFNSDTNEMLLTGMGVLHVDVIKDYLKNMFDVEINLVSPQIGYLETISGKAKTQGKYKKQTGGHGQYGDVHIEIEPKSRNDSEVFEFVDKIVGGAIPRNYIPSVEKGVKEALGSGTLANYPVVGIRVTLFDGSFHAVDSSDFAFQRAGAMAIRKALPDARPVLLEPVMEMEIDVLEGDVGKVTKDLSGRRGKVASYSYKDFTTVIHAEAPLAELMDYTQSLRGITLGMGRFSLKLKSYEVLASNLAEKVIASRKVDEE